MSTPSGTVTELFPQDLEDELQTFSADSLYDLDSAWLRHVEAASANWAHAQEINRGAPPLPYADPEQMFRTQVANILDLDAGTILLRRDYPNLFAWLQKSVHIRKNSAGALHRRITRVRERIKKIMQARARAALTGLDDRTGRRLG